MQDKYVGDVGDFGKYGLLRWLCGADRRGTRGRLSLAVIWCLVPDDDRAGDGRFTAYLDPTPENALRFRACDPFLYDALTQFRTGKRHVSAIAGLKLFPDTTLYYAEPCVASLSSTQGPRRQLRLKHRRDWLQGALEATRSTDLVFLDPDNGLRRDSAKGTRQDAKYVFMEELEPFVLREQSLIVYSHAHRLQPVERQILTLLGDVRLAFPSLAPFAARYSRGSVRMFIVIPARKHQAHLAERALGLMDTPWGQHFQLLPRDVLQRSTG